MTAAHGRILPLLTGSHGSVLGQLAALLCFKALCLIL